MRFKIGPKTISIPSARWPHLSPPPLRLVSALRLPPAPDLARFIPRIALKVGGTKAVFLSLLMVGVGFFAAIMFVMEKTERHVPIWPEPGAVYALAEPGGTIGQPLPPDSTDGSQNMTLELRFAADARLSTLTFDNLSLGKSGVTCVTIARATGNSSGYLWIQDMIMSNVTAPTLDIANSEIAVLTIAGSVDGHTWGGTISSTVTELVVTSTRGSGTFEAKDSVVDRILITLVGDATIGTLTFADVACGSGSSVGWDLDWIKAGRWTQDATSKFGTGNGINTADWVMQSSVSYKSGSSGLVDTPITVR